MRASTAILFTIAVFIAFIGGCGAALAGGLSIQVVSPDAGALPGDLVTHVFRVSNLSPEVAHVRLAADLPSGWFDLGLPAQLELPPQSAQDVFLTVIVPHQAHGEYLVRLIAAAGEAEVAAAAVVRVHGVSAVEVHSPGDERAFAGMQVILRFRVTNAGNAPDTYALSAASSRGWPVTWRPNEVALMPGESTSVEVRLTIPRDARGTDVVVLRARSTTDPLVEDEAQAGLRIAGVLAEPEPLVAVLKARSVVTYDPVKRAGRFTLSAGGPLDPERRDRGTISLRMQAPAPRTGEGVRPLLASLVYEQLQAKLAAGDVAVREGAAARIDGYGVDWSAARGELSWGATALAGSRYALRASLARGPLRLFSFLRVEKVQDATRPLVLAAGGSVRGEAPWVEWALEAEAAGRIFGGLGAGGARLKADAIVARHRLSLSAESWERGLVGSEAESRLSAAWLTHSVRLGNLGVYASLSSPEGGFRGEERTLEERVYLGRSLTPQLFAYAQQHRRVRVASGVREDDEAGFLAGLRLSPFRRRPQAHLTFQLSEARHRRLAADLEVRQRGAHVGASLPVASATLTAQGEYKRVDGDGGVQGESAALTVNLKMPTGRAGVLELRWRSEWNLLAQERAAIHSVRYSHQLTDRLSLTAKAEHRGVWGGTPGRWRSKARWTSIFPRLFR